MRTIKEIGEQLREYRVENNINIDEIIRKLHTPKAVIKSLEDGTFKASNVKTRLIYKKYIEVLNLEYKDYEEEIKRLYPNVVEKRIDLSDEVLINEVKFKKKKLTIDKSLVSILVVCIFLILLIVLTFYNFSNKVAINEVENKTTLLEEVTLDPIKIIEPKIQELKVKRLSLNQIEVYLKSLKNVKIKVESDGVTYYDYSIAGLIKEQGTLNKKEKKEFKVEDATSLTMNIGNLPTTKIYVNDYEITQVLKDKGFQNYIIFKKED